MLKVNKKVEYALMALKHMSQEQEKGKTLHPTTTREICKIYNIPFDPMAKVMQTLCNAQILRSMQGVKGGYQLERDLGQITYFDLELLINNYTFGEQCNGPKGHCQQFSNCNIIGPLNNLNAKMIEFFKQITLRDLLQEGINSTSCQHHLVYSPPLEEDSLWPISHSETL